MSATTTVGLTTYLTKGSQAPVNSVPTAISKAKPAKVTAANTFIGGEVVYCSGTGFPELDGKYFIVGAQIAASYDLIGSNTTGSTGVLGATPNCAVYAQSGMVKMCLSTVDPAVDAAGTTSVGTFCDPSATVPAIQAAGTLTMTGFVEDADYYEELNLAVEDLKERILDIKLPNGLGDIIVPATLSSIGWQLPIDGGIGFTVSGAMGSNPKHRF